MTPSCDVAAYPWRTATQAPEETIALGRALAPLLQENDVVILTGDLGAGKTQFTKGVAQGLGISEDLMSPTFNIMLVYDDGRIPLYHFDLYRLDERWELVDVDYHGLLEDGAVCLVEWAEKFPEDLPESYLEVCILVAYGDAKAASLDEVVGATGRTVLVRGVGERGRELASAWAETCRMDRTS